MVVIDNKEDNDSKNSNINKEGGEQNNKTERYTIDKRELTFPIDGLKNAKVVDSATEIPDGQTEVNYLKGKQAQIQQPKTPEQLKAEDLKFIHLPDDPAYRPISLELIKMNEFENEDLKLNTRIMMNIALSDYVIFRRLSEDGDIEDNVKVYFRRVRTNEFQQYVDLQTQLDDLVKRVGIVEMTYPFTLELQDKLYDYQRKLIDIARKRVRKGYDIFFKWENQEQRDQLADECDSNDMTFNVDCAFIRITKSPFLRRKSSHTS